MKTINSDRIQLRSGISVLIMALLILLVAYAVIHALIATAEKNTLVGKAEQFVRGAYSGDFARIAGMANGKLRDDILSGVDQTVVSAKGKTLESISLSAYTVTSSDTREVILQVYEIPHSTVLFKHIKFQRFGKQWLIVSVAHDA